MAGLLHPEPNGGYSMREANRIWNDASEEGREWVRHKQGWEQRGRIAILSEWGMPTREEAIAHGIRATGGSEDE